MKTYEKSKFSYEFLITPEKGIGILGKFDS